MQSINLDVPSQKPSTKFAEPCGTNPTSERYKELIHTSQSYIELASRPVYVLSRLTRLTSLSLLCHAVLQERYNPRLLVNISHADITVPAYWRGISLRTVARHTTPASAVTHGKLRNLDGL
jgi:hypothetical protein